MESHILTAFLQYLIGFATGLIYATLSERLREYGEQKKQKRRTER